LNGFQTWSSTLREEHRLRVFQGRVLRKIFGDWKRLHNEVLYDLYFDTSLHVDVVTDASKLPWHKYLKGQQSKNIHPYNPPASLSPAVDYRKVVTELMAGLGTAQRILCG